MLRGTGFVQTRPIWGQTNNYFSEKAGLPKPNSPYYLGGGGVGGAHRQEPHVLLVRDRELPRRPDPQRQRDDADQRASGGGLLADDQCRRAAGGRSTTRSPGSRLPATSSRPAASTRSPLAMLQYLPLPDVERDNGSANYTRTSLINNKFQQLYSVKVDHKLTDALSLSGFYLYNRTDEPDANYFGTADQTEPNRFADPNDYILVRRPQILALNSNWVLTTARCCRCASG